MLEEQEDKEVEGLSPISPDISEQEEDLDNIVPTRGYHMTPMVGLGGSAGSFSGLQEFFKGMPVDSGMVFVVVLHLSPQHESILAELLQRSTRMPVIQAQQNERVHPNHVYVIPPGKALTCLDGHLHLSDLAQDRGRRVAIDLFFRSLADTHGPHSAAIVLSGADGDGAIGIKRIKERGGLTIAQTPDECEHSGMPRAAIATGMVDWVLNVREMPSRLLEYQRSEKKLKVPPEEGPQPAASPRPAPNESEAALRDVLTFLRTRTGRDFSYYKRATILRRIARRMQVAGVDDLVQYLTYLRTHPGESGALLQDLLISVTNFFRDRDAFDALTTRLDTVFQNKGPGDAIRVWVPACATGEEAYSLAMMLSEHARTIDAPPAIQIFATDLDEEVIRVAREGVYPETIAADVSEDRLRKFFTKEHRGYRVRREIREMVLFAVHDLLRDSPFSRLDLISCRNLLIYLTRDAQTRVLDIFHFAMRSDGILFLGTSESVEDGGPLFGTLDKKFRIYSHRAAHRVGLPVPSGPSTVARALQEQERSRQSPVIARRAMEGGTLDATLRLEQLPERGVSWGELHYKLIERFAPPSVIVDSEHEIVHMSETVGGFLQLSGGEPTRNILRLVHPMLRIELRAVLYRAAQTRQPGEVRSVPCQIDNEHLRVTIRVMPAEEVLDGGWLIVFEAVPAKESESDAPVHTNLEREPAARHLEHELERMKAHLRDTVEQYEASTEELKAGNEELQAMNEELRSATEELETSREELQSINEELTTVNQELKSKVDELGHANSDLHNLMASTAIGTVFLDRDLKITRYTPTAVVLFNLIPTDVGRPLSDLTRRLEYPELQDDAAAVLEKLVPIEREVGNPDGKWYLARLLPYRTIDDRIAGIVLTFVDITEGQLAKELLRKSEDRLRQTNNALDERVRERTQELRESESKLRQTAAASEKRAEQMRTLATQVSEAEQKERRRLAMVLHDHVQQTLVAARLRAEVLATETSDETLRKHLAVILESINDSINAARSLAVELVPPMLHDQGLAAAVDWLAAQFKRQYDLQVDVSASSDCSPANENDRDLLFQSIRELLLNVVKHAKVKKARISLTQTNRDFVVEVHDSGAGFNPDKLPASHHTFGLTHMRERFESVGGKVTVESQQGKGSRIILAIPTRK